MEGMDLSASLSADLLRMCKGDKAKAQQLASGLKGQMQEEQKRAQNRKIDELAANFPNIDREAIERILGENEWDVEKAIVPCFEFLEKQREEQRKQEQLEQQRKREQERARLRREAQDFLAQLFSNVPAERIQDLLDEHEGDVDQVTQQLLSEEEERKRTEEKAMAEAEAEKRRIQEEEERRQRQAEIERQVKVDALKQRFGDYCTEDEILNMLTKHQYDVRVASSELLRLVEERKLEQLKRLHPGVSDGELSDALYQNGWDLIKTMKYLRAAQAEKKVKQEEEERLRREQEERTKREQEELQAKLTAEEEAKARAAAKEREAAEAKAREEAEAKAREVEAAASEEKKKVAEDLFLERSIIIGKELEEIIQAQQKIAERDADPRHHIKQELENKLKFGPGNLPGLPGMVPLTRKLIDQRQGRESPVPAPVEPTEQDLPEKVKVLPTPGMEFTEVDSASVSDSKITLQASPESLDIKQTITVKWEMEDQPSSSDWIGLYKVGSDNNSYVIYNWLGSTEKKGSMNFKPTEFGDYEIRYFASTSSFFSRQYSVKAVSNLVRVGPQLNLVPAWNADTNTLSVKIDQKSGNQYPSAWVGLYVKGEKDNSQYRAFDWLTNAVDHTLSFACPKAGDWEFRFFPQRSYVDVARAIINVGGTDKVELSLVNGQMIVTTELTTVDPAYDNVWVGIYKSEENDNRQYRKYKYVGQAAGTIVFRACTTPSTYEARIFAHKSLDVVCKSNTIVVPPKQQ